MSSTADKEFAAVVTPVHICRYEEPERAVVTEVIRKHSRTKTIAESNTEGRIRQQTEGCSRMRQVIRVAGGFNASHSVITTTRHPLQVHAGRLLQQYALTFSVYRGRHACLRLQKGRV